MMVAPFGRGRVMIGGLRGGSGKTMIALGLIGALKRRGVPVAAFKKGPDYIDAAWHRLATSRPCYCLDVYMMGAEAVARQFALKRPRDGVAVIEGNRGLFDGVDPEGSYSTAELAKLLQAPTLLVVDATKITRTAAALVLGCQRLDPDLNLIGVVLNQVAGARHREIVTRSIEQTCGLPVLGAVPKLPAIKAPERHLGLVTPEDTPDAEGWVKQMAAAIEPYLDVDRLLELIGAHETDEPVPPAPTPRVVAGRKVKIGVIRDSAFPFYYAENLEALERLGAELCWINSLEDPALPPLDALYLGGGFPEIYAGRLERCDRLRRSLKREIESGLPVYAECGGAIYLGRRLHHQGRSFEMAGVFPVDFEFCPRPQGHGYVKWRIERDNPFYPRGLEITGHEFHYTRVKDPDPAGVVTVARVDRGVGFGSSREGLMVHRVVAFYGHVHALGCKEWAAGVIRAAEARASDRS